MSNPVNDAEDVADALRNLNYEVIVLTNANYQAMLNAVQQFAERLAQLGFVGLFYFSGHGLQTGGNNYLVPVDAKIKTEADIKPFSLNANHVLAKMNETQSQVNVMILDACRNNPFRHSFIKSLSSKGLARIVAPSGNFISFATAPMQPAWGGKENERNSIYTKHLLATMKNQADVPIGEVLIGVRNKVMLETKAQQVPWDSSSLRHQFCFGECRVDIVPPSEPPIVIPPSSVNGDQVNFAAIFNYPQNMFEKTEEYHLRLDNSLAKFNQAGRNGDKRYQAGVVSLSHYDAETEILSFEIKWQAKWLKQFFSDFPYEKQKWIGIAPSEAKALWKAGKERPFFIIVKRLGDNSIISGAILRRDTNFWLFKIGQKVWHFGSIDKVLIPKMVRIPAGSFKMSFKIEDEIVSKKISIKSFFMSKYEVTFAEYDQFAEADGREKPNDQGWGRGNRPVIHVSWHDATAYAEWLSQQTGQTYRLPTASEWEYAARAGTDTKYWWGNTASHEYANYGKDKCCGGLAEGKDRWKYTSPVGSFAANPFGLYDTLGNVWEWTCYDGEEKPCVTTSASFISGGSWEDVPGYVESDNHVKIAPSNRAGNNGFRVVRILTP